MRLAIELVVPRARFDVRWRNCVMPERSMTASMMAAPTSAMLFMIVFMFIPLLWDPEEPSDEQYSPPVSSADGSVTLLASRSSQ